MKPLKAEHWWRNRLVAASHKTGRGEVRHGAPPASDFACLAQVRASLVGSCAPRQVEMSEPAMKSANGDGQALSALTPGSELNNGATVTFRTHLLAPDFA
ncbi:hypothetical protein R6Z07F_000793 [Ovis aries]